MLIDIAEYRQHMRMLFRRKADLYIEDARQDRPPSALGHEVYCNEMDTFPETPITPTHLQNSAGRGRALADEAFEWLESHLFHRVPGQSDLLEYEPRHDVVLSDKSWLINKSYELRSSEFLEKFPFEERMGLDKMDNVLSAEGVLFRIAKKLDCSPAYLDVMARKYALLRGKHSPENAENELHGETQEKTTIYAEEKDLQKICAFSEQVLDNQPWQDVLRNFSSRSL